MADAPKKRRASGPRTARPLFAIVSYRDESGAPVKLDRANLSVKLERDAGKLVEMVTDPDFGSAAVVKADLPAPTQRAAAPAPATA